MSRKTVIRLIGIATIIAGIAILLCCIMIPEKFALALEIGNGLSIFGWIVCMLFMSTYGLLFSCFGVSLVYNPLND